MALVRQAVSYSTVPQYDEYVVSFAQECEQKLGYAGLSKHLKNPASNHLVAHALRELHIDPYSTKSVRTYQKKKEIFAYLKNIPMFLFLAAVTTSFLLIFAGPIVAGICAYCDLHLFSLPAGWYALIAPISGLIGIFLCAALSDSPLADYSVSWERMSLSAYQKLVPEFALQTALEIKEQCGDGVHLFIEEFVVERKPLDPFLIAHDTVTGEDFYLEVWNEAKFDRKNIELLENRS